MNLLDPVQPSAAQNPAPSAGFSKALFALILGQIFLHSCMAGVRVAAPLLALRSGHPQWAIGILLGLFAAAPVLTSLRAGRLADQHGYHFPMRIAVGLTTFARRVVHMADSVAVSGAGRGRHLVRCRRKFRFDRHSAHCRSHDVGQWR
jgi:hypothetical protein